MIKKEEENNCLKQEQTDELLPRAWKSGSLKYDELNPLGEGGTAKLFLTEDINLHRKVAYKTLHKDLQDSEIETQRFVREARVTANIQHPGTVPVYELGRDREGQLFFTMKRVYGQDLRQILLDLKHEVPEIVEKFPLPRLLDILIQVSQTIAYAHAIGTGKLRHQEQLRCIGQRHDTTRGLGERPTQWHDEGPWYKSNLSLRHGTTRHAEGPW